MAVSHVKTLPFITGEPKFIDSLAGLVTTPGVLQTVFSVAVPIGKTWSLYQLVVVCRMMSRFSLLADGDLIASGRTGAGQANILFPWVPPRKLIEATVIELKVLSPVDQPAVDIEAYLQAAEDNA